MMHGGHQFTALLLALVLGFIALFQLLLALGLPWGEWAYGGFHSGTLPRGLRVSSGVAVVVWALASLMVLQVGGIIHIGVPQAWELPFLWVLAALLGLAAAMNAMSKSRKERFLWTPVASAACALCLHLLAGS